jgi:hypothetical protein
VGSCAGKKAFAELSVGCWVQRVLFAAKASWIGLREILSQNP